MVKTLAEAMILVVLVVYLFLQSWRATLIPMRGGSCLADRAFAGMMSSGFRSIP